MESILLILFFIYFIKFSLRKGQLNFITRIILSQRIKKYFMEFQATFVLRKYHDKHLTHPF